MNFDYQNFIWALKNSLIQGLGTVFICLTFGSYLALGLMFFSNKNQAQLRPLCLISYILPSLFTILISLNSLPLFPYGHLGVIFIFTVMHLGFVTIYVAQAIEKKIVQLDIVSRAYNISRFNFYLRIFWPTLRKDYLTLGSIIFLSCISSLSVPLLAGGGKGTNLEVYIYEKIFIEQSWFEALVLSAVQFLSLFFLTQLVFKNKNDPSDTTNKIIVQKLKSRSSAALLLTLLIVYIFGYLYKVTDVFLETNLGTVFDADFFLAWVNSMFLFAGFFLISSLLLVLVLYQRYSGYKTHILNVFLYPSTVLLGFTFYLLLPVNSVFFDYIKMAFGLLILFFAGLYQSYVAVDQKKLDRQILICRVYQIQFSGFLKNIFWPQTRKNILFLVSLLYLISISEFALFKASGVQIQTLGVLSELYLNSYRMNQAYLISFFGLATWCLFYFILRGIYADYPKS